MTQSFENVQTIKVSTLSANQSYAFSLGLNTDEIEAICRDLDLQALRKASFVGRLSPLGKSDWALKAHLGATVVQTCVVTLGPVTTRIDEPVERVFVSEMPDLPEGEDEVEMPEDERIDPLGSHISLLAVFREALSLALPPYPRAAGAELREATFAEPGVAPMRDEDARPFAGLASLKDKLENKGES